MRWVSMSERLWFDEEAIQSVQKLYWDVEGGSYQTYEIIFWGGGKRSIPAEWPEGKALAAWLEKQTGLVKEGA